MMSTLILMLASMLGTEIIKADQVNWNKWAGTIRNKLDRIANRLNVNYNDLTRMITDKKGEAFNLLMSREPWVRDQANQLIEQLNEKQRKVDRRYLDQSSEIQDKVNKTDNVANSSIFNKKKDEVKEINNFINEFTEDFSNENQ